MLVCRDANLSPHSKDVSARNITCKLKISGDTRARYKSCASVPKVKKDKLLSDGPGDGF